MDDVWRVAKGLPTNGKPIYTNSIQARSSPIFPRLSSEWGYGGTIHCRIRKNSIISGPTQNNNGRVIAGTTKRYGIAYGCKFPTSIARVSPLDLELIMCPLAHNILPNYPLHKM